MEKSGVSSNIIFNLMEGQFTPVNFSEPQFERKVKNLEKVAEQQSNDKTGYYVNEDFVYPQEELREVQEEWSDKQFFPETWNAETKQLEGGYKPEEVGYKRDEKGKLIRDDRGKLIKEPTFLDKAVPYIKEKISPFSGIMGQKSQTPLPPTPGIDPQIVGRGANLQANRDVMQTGLTSTEQGLLSNEEKAIRLRQRGLA